MGFRSKNCGFGLVREGVVLGILTGRSGWGWGDRGHV
jgi:hypothetical protein